jgi:hypothetical protein
MIVEFYILQQFSFEFRYGKIQPSGTEVPSSAPCLFNV